MKKLYDRLEFSLLKFLLRRHADHHMDQWERWRMKSKYGEVFIEISRNDDGYNYDSIDE